MTRAVELAVDISSNAALEGFDQTGRAALDMAADIDRATSDAAAAASRLDGLAGAAEGLDDTFGRATGALGALSSGFELVGLDAYAEGLQKAALATDFLSGVGQSLNVVLGLSGVATKAMTIAQGALNAVMALNPILLVVIAVAALVAAFVLAYKRSETFRNIVNKAMDAVKNAIGAVVDKVGELVSWVVDRAGPAWAVLRDTVVTMLAGIRDRFQPVLDTAKSIFDKIKTTISTVIESVRDKIKWFKDEAVGFFDKLLGPVDAIVAAVQGLIDLISKVKLPKPPDWLTSMIPGRVSLPAFPGRSTFPGPGSGGGDTISITLDVKVDPLTDPHATAAAIVDALNDYLVSIGRQPVAV